MKVNLAPGRSRLNLGDALVLHALDNGVDGRRFRRPRARERQRARDIARVAVPLAAGVDDDALLAAEGGVVGAVVQSRAVGSRPSNDGIRLGAGAAGDAHRLDNGLDLPLVGEAQDALGDPAMGGARDIVGAAHHGDLVVGLDDTGAVHGRQQEGGVETQLGLASMAQVRRLLRMKNVRDWRRGLRCKTAQKAAQLCRVPHLIDIVAALALGSRRFGAEPEDLTRLDIRDP